MVSDPAAPSLPELTRRRVLAGVGGAVGLATVGSIAVGATAPTALPDVLTDEATKHYPTPPGVTEHWRPTVTEAHARDVVETLATTHERADERWAEIDEDRFGSGGDGWLESARSALDAGNHHEALFDATYGLQFAANDLGRARAKLDDADLPALAERAVDVRDRATSLLDALAPYPVDDPSTDLAWYLRIEEEAVRGTGQATWSSVDATANGVDDDDGPPRGEFDPRRVGDLTEGVVLGDVAVSNAERFHEHLQERLGDDVTPYDSHLRAVSDDLRDVLADAPSRETVLERHDVRSTDDHGPDEFAHSRLARWCYDAPIVSPWATQVDADARTLTAVALAQGVVDHRAHGFAIGHLVVDETTTGFDSGHVLAEKRRARSTYQNTIGDDPDPLLTRQAARAIEDLQVATVDHSNNDGHWTAWKERLDAYLYALVGRAKLHHHPKVYHQLVDGP
ncbi:hypothetical protein [Halorubellus sp. PRR65]|uniref:hypothetical protein n=1 Tax=Halorubellus sp. PRR65 TaxID=3098148 RepID=UPI002B262A36|nr:hypothetical protein [Halorubellus sp. PRR65]